MNLEKLVALLAEHVDCEPSEITESTTFESLGIDSLDTVEIIMQLEDELGVELQLEEKLVSVGDFLKFLQEKLG